MVVVTTDGSDLLLVYLQGEQAVCVVGKEAHLLRRDRAAAFGSPDLAASSNKGEAP